MFGGVAFLVNGHMSVGVAKADLMVRVGPERHLDALNLPGARPMDFTGRPMKGFVFVGAAGSETLEAVDLCLGLSLEFVLALPPKPEQVGARRGSGSRATKPRAKRRR